MINKSVIGFGVITLVASTIMSPASANDAYMPELIPTPQNSVMFMMVEPSNTSNFNYLIVKKDAHLQSSNSIDWIYCNSFEDPTCDFNDQSKAIFANSVLPPGGNGTTTRMG